MRYVPRAAAGRLTRLLRDFPTVLVHGPRQCGKSTLVRAVCRDFDHVDLERPAHAGLLEADLEGFLRAHPRRLSIDEAQRMPALFPALRHAIDAGPGMGRFVLTGSASPTLIRGVTESLAAADVLRGSASTKMGKRKRARALPAVDPARRPASRMPSRNGGQSARSRG